ncbi:uncharacterized protein [Paramormyrops kingsleyae]|uniref:Uncharacterized LOC111854157 n=1 Tax=Paramormyrops kingsleyae TaxID=1676925 RepID=A0A3B3QC90_9TELE|nr:uncharacterized protein LOC111854157 isoform X2 [Paramormyrops kingsleyae]
MSSCRSPDGVVMVTNIAGEINMARLLLLQVVLLPSVLGLFTVEVASPSYQAEFDDSVSLECRFAPVDSTSNLSVFWHRILPKPPLGVYSLQNGQEDLSFPDPHFSGRVELPKDSLSSGKALLNINKLRINDSGTYQCLVEMVGADYKQTTLTVKATYQSVKKSIRSTGGDEVELSCQAEGYPLAKVVWTDGRGRKLENDNFTNFTSSDQLIHITSQVTIKTFSNNYTCTVMGERQPHPFATFTIPEEIPGTYSGKPPIGLVFLAVFVVTVVTAVALLLYHRQKGHKRHNALRNNEYLIQENIAAALEEGQVGELRKVLKNRHVELFAEVEEGQLRALCDNELPHRLRSREGVTVDVTSLLPDVRETVLLEGKTGCGKSSVALSLASIWAHDFDWDPFGVTQLLLLILVTCKGIMGDLFQEAASQLNLGGQLTAEGLRTLMAGPVEGLLILDGYREGSKELDESLARFLRDRQICRVLITAQPGQCGILEKSCGTILQLPSMEPETQGLS